MGETERYAEYEADRLRRAEPATAERDVGALPNAIETAFRAVNRLEEVQGVVRDRLTPIMVSGSPLAHEGIRLAEDDNDALVVKQIREIASRVDLASATRSETLNRLTL